VIASHLSVGSQAVKRAVELGIRAIAENRMQQIIKNIAEKRRQYLKGVKANDGDISLDIFSDFYPDKAHFIYELLQNAEDAGAEHVEITLDKKKCHFRHNGSRKFDEKDIRSITGLHNSTKSESIDKIGQFGIGFKSVYAYTNMPIIRSGDISFKILDYVLPVLVDHDTSIGEDTIIEVPFRGDNKTIGDAFDDVAAGLADISNMTPLFLSCITSINWKSTKGLSGGLRKITHSANHIEIVSTVGKKTTSSHFLIFSEDVENLGGQKLSVAFDLTNFEEDKGFDPNIPIAEQMKVSESSPGKVAVFFPAKSEQSGLRFHIHAPFIPELSRASIKDSPLNDHLFTQLAGLFVSSLDKIKSLGFLTREFLGVIPNNQDVLLANYQKFRELAIQEVIHEPLFPTHDGGLHVPARSLMQANESIKSFLTNKDLKNITGKKCFWSLAPIGDGSNADRLINSLEIHKFDLSEWLEIVSGAGWHRDSAGKIKFEVKWRDVLGWMSKKSTKWHSKFYALIFAEVGSRGGHSIPGLQIVLTQQGEYACGRDCYYPDEQSELHSNVTNVSSKILDHKEGKEQSDLVKRFLDLAGVRELGEGEKIELILKERYTSPQQSELVSQKLHLSDLNRFIKFLKEFPEEDDLFSRAYIFDTADGWKKSKDIFLDEPFVQTNLRSFYTALREMETNSQEGNSESDEATIDVMYVDTTGIHYFFSGLDLKFELSDKYNEMPLSSVELGQFCRQLGAQVSINFSRSRIGNEHPFAYELKRDLGYGVRRTHTYINFDCDEPIICEMLRYDGSVSLSKLVWSNLGRLRFRHRYPDGDGHPLVARYRPNQTYKTREAPTTFCHELKQIKWIPQVVGDLGKGNKNKAHKIEFVTPASADPKRLPKDFTCDDGEPWLDKLDFATEIEEKQREKIEEKEFLFKAGFTDERTHPNAQWFAGLSKEQQDELKAEHKAKKMPELNSVNSNEASSSVLDDNYILISQEETDNSKQRAADGNNHYSRSPKVREEMDKIGMDTVMKNEELRGRNPVDVSSKKLGYDIRSFCNERGEDIYVEVKTRDMDASTVRVTKNELENGCELSDRYFLAIVRVKGKKLTRTRYVKNPFNSPPPEGLIDQTYKISHFLNRASDEIE
jgi:hypothetical protein